MSRVSQKALTADQALSIDKNGVFRHEGVEITHPGTLDLFFKSLESDEKGGYLVRVGREWAPVRVEDTPFAVRSVREYNDSLRIILNDGTEEKLESRTLEVGAENVLYCRVKDGRFPARFLRPAYYQIAQHIRPSETGGFDLVIAGKRFAVDSRQSPAEPEAG